MVTFRKSKLTEEYLETLNLNERQKKIIKFIEENRKITTSQCAHLLNVSKDTALRELLRLRSFGLVEQKGIGRGIYYTIK